MTHTPSGGGASSISAVFQEPYEVMGEYGQVSNSRPSVVFRNADATMSKDDTVVRAGTTYNVMEVESTVASNGSRRAFLSQNTT